MYQVSHNSATHALTHPQHLSSPYYHHQQPPSHTQQQFRPAGFDSSTTTISHGPSTSTPSRHSQSPLQAPTSVSRPYPRPHQPHSPHTPLRNFRQNPQLVMDTSAFSTGPSPTLSPTATPTYERQSAPLAQYANNNVNASASSSTAGPSYSAFRPPSMPLQYHEQGAQQAQQGQQAQMAQPMSAAPGLAGNGMGNEGGIRLFEMSPMEGAAGSLFSVKCDIIFNEPGQPPSQGGHMRGRAARLVFGQMPIPTSVSLVPDHRAEAGQACQLTATVPPWSPQVGGIPQHGRLPRVHVSVQIMIGEAVLNSMVLGEFSYSQSAPPPRVPVYNNYMPQGSGVKREGDPMESYRTSPMTPRRIATNAIGLRYDSPEQPMNSYQATSSQTDVASPYSPYGTQSLSAQQATFAGAGPSQPSLQRATQVPAAVPAAPTSYSGPGKASLELQGDVNNMAKGWSQDEWQNRRRLVQFWRKQEGTNIVAAFSPISQQDYSGHQQSIIVSCIFREDDNQCYITSVDTIYLLEALIGNRFTVEEKNRIRRNLEGFRPQTVSKTKASSEEFFKLIMGFPNPKPRNIEKDVKVFTWDILGHALKKIISKYTACYSGPITPQSAPPMSLPGGYSAPYPSVSESIPQPLQQPSTDSYDNSTGSAPTLVSDGSGDSSSQYNSSNSAVFTSAQPATPHHMPTHQGPGGGGDPHTPMRQTGAMGGHQYSNVSPAAAMSHDKPNNDQYLNLSPTATTSATPYSNTAGNPYWTTGASGTNEGVIPSPGSAAYTALAAGGMGYGDAAGHYTDQGHNLPHVHQSLSRQPSANDLRIVYPGMSQ